MAAWAIALVLAAFLHVLAFQLGGSTLGGGPAAALFAWTVPVLGAAVCLSGLRLWGLRA